MIFRIYKGGLKVAEGTSPLALIGLESNKLIPKGTYKAVKFDGTNESDPIDIEAFTTLVVNAASVSLTPKTSTAASGTSGSRKLSAGVLPANSANKAVTYAISPSATGLAVDNTGNITWTDLTPANTYTTTVTTTDGSFTDTHVLTLT